MLNVNDYRFVVRNLSYEEIEHVEGNKFLLEPIYKSEIGKIDETHYYIEVEVKIGNTKDKPVPFIIDAKVRVEYRFSNFTDIKKDKTTIVEFLQSKGLLTLFPYLRSVVTGISTTAMISPVYLPLIDIRNVSNKTIICI